MGKNEGGEQGGSDCRCIDGGIVGGNQKTEGGTGECPTSTLQMTPERVCREIHLPVGACSAQSPPSFHRRPRNPMTIQSIIDYMKFQRPRSHRVSAKPVPSVQVNLFSWMEQLSHYTRREVLVQQEHQVPKKIPTGVTPPHSCRGRGCDDCLPRSIGISR